MVERLYPPISISATSLVSTSWAGAMSAVNQCARRGSLPELSWIELEDPRRPQPTVDGVPVAMTWERLS